MDLSNSVIIPREDFLELQAVAWDSTPPAAKERIGSTIQTTFICMGVAAAVSAGTWGYATAMNWKDERTLRRAMLDPKYKDSPKL
jgi:hypothetical protein